MVDFANVDEDFERTSCGFGERNTRLVVVVWWPGFRCDVVGATSRWAVLSRFEQLRVDNVIAAAGVVAWPVRTLI